MTKKRGLKNQKCVPCEGGARPLDLSAAREYLAKIPGWRISEDGSKISREFRMKDFAAGVRFVNTIAAVAENENHHPDFHLTGYRNLRVELSTHALGGLSENDFVLAAKINGLLGPRRGSHEVLLSKV